MASISLALRRINQDLRLFLPDSLITQACLEAGHHWRKRQLDPIATIHLFILQILSFNTAITHLRHLSGIPLSAAAYCKARMRLPLEVLQQLLRRSAEAMTNGQGSLRLWHGLRVYLVDGSATIAPDTPDLQKHFPQRKSQKPGCGFPEVKILGLFDAFSGLITELLCFWIYSEDRAKVWHLHPRLEKGDLLAADRGFCSYVHLAMLSLRDVLALFRMHQRQIVDFRPHRKSRGKGQCGKPSSRFVKRLGRHDQLVRWLKPPLRPKWMTQGQWQTLPDSLLVRELRFTLAAKGQRTRQITLVTTLLDPLLYPKEAIADLYQVRWTVETHFAELKTTLKMRRLKCQTALGVQKELAVYCLVYNLVHLVILQAARRQHTTPDRISFIDTVRWLLCAKPGEPLPDLMVNPRRHRHQLRVVKDRHDTYPYLNKPRAVLQKALKKQAMEA
jgi:hypothetical protein